MGKISSITGLSFKSCPRQYSDAKEAVQDYKVRAAEQLCMSQGRIYSGHA
jgi:hypothetical protein